MNPTPRFSFICLLFLTPGIVLAQANPAASASPAPTPAAPTDAQIKAATTAIADANQVLSNAKALEVQANTLINKWKSLPESSASTAAALQTLEGIYQAVSDAADGPGLRSKLSSMSDSLKAQSDTVTSKQKDLLVAGSSTPTDDVKNLYSQCDAVSKDITDEKSTLDGLSTSFADPIKRNYTFFTASFTAMDTSLATLLQLKKDEQSETVRQALVSQLPVYASLNKDSSALVSEWNKFKGKLSTFFPAAADAKTLSDPVDAASTKASSDLQRIPANFCAWFDTLTKASTAQAGDLNNDKAKLTADYAGNRDAALAHDTKGKTLQDSLKKISDAWDRILANPPAFPAGDCSLDQAKINMKGLRDGLPALSGALVEVEDVLSGDRSAWIADQIRLYYFTDVERLVQILNSAVTKEGGVSEAADKAAAARKDLLNADLTLSDAQADVNKYQNQLLNLKEQLRQAQAQQKSTSFLFGKTSSLVNRLTGRSEAAQRDATQKSGDLNSPDPLKKAAAEQAKNKADSINSQLDTAKQANDNAQKDRDASQQNLDTIQDQQQGLPAQIKAAQAALEAAQAMVNKLRNATIVAAQDESDAFAAARDQTPYLKTIAIPGSSDPAHRVEIYGFTDSKSVFIRGAKSDVGKVKQIINGFDQPAPQARITLWSLQLNSAGDHNNASTKRFNQALQQVETELSNNRALVAASLSLLRDAVNEQVNLSAGCEFPLDTTEWTLDQAARAKRVYCFYNDEVLNALALRTDNDNFRYISQWTLPDPAGTTTLGETLMVLSLGKRCLRQNAWNKFTSNLDTRLKNLNLPCGTVAKDKGTCPRIPFQDDKDNFMLTTRVLNLDGNAEEDGLTPAQVEIVHGLESWSLKHIVDRAQFLYAQLQGVTAQLGTANKQFDYLQQPLTAAKQQLEQTLKAKNPARDAQLAKIDKQIQIAQEAKNDKALASLQSQKEKVEANFATTVAELQSQLTALEADLASSKRSSAHVTQPLKTRSATLNEELAPLAAYLFERAHISFEELVAYEETRTNVALGSPEKTAALTQFAGKAVELVKQSDTFLESKARVAAADEMLKEMMIAVEDDLDRLFVHPMTVRLRDDLVTIPSLNVGVLQKTSLLATNRLVARVDPRASAQLGLGQETDILQSLLQLGEVFVAAKTGGPLGALNSLNAQKREARPKSIL